MGTEEHNELFELSLQTGGHGGTDMGVFDRVCLFLCSPASLLSKSEISLTKDVELRVREQGLSILQNLTTTQTEIAYLITTLTDATITDILHASMSTPDGDVVLRVRDLHICSIFSLLTASRQRSYCPISFPAQMTTVSSFWVHTHSSPTSVQHSPIRGSMSGEQR